MEKLTEKLYALKKVCDAEEGELIEGMIRSAGDYVRAVTQHMALRLNFTGLEPEEYRTKETDLGTSRSRIHEGLITSVKAVNRLCEVHGLEPIYTGENHRYHIAAFAMALVAELFEMR